MKTLSTALLAALIALTLACGYSSPASTPAVAGSMPSIAELAPDNTNSGGTAFVLTVNGSDFSSKATINWNGTAQTTTYVSASQLTARSPLRILQPPATVPITVTNPATSGTGVYAAAAPWRRLRVR